MGIISRMLPRLLKIIALTLALGACSLMAPKFNRPNVTVIGIQMRSGNLLQQNFAVKLNIQNPNDRALPVSGLHIELNVGGERIASGVSDDEGSVTAPSPGAEPPAQKPMFVELIDASDVAELSFSNANIVSRAILSSDF